jgi:type IV pilus assembly protein PilW
MTILELLVAAVVGLLLVAMTMGATIANQNIYQLDLSRTRLNQNIRGAVELIGVDIRQAGERLPSGFPAIEIVNGASGASDELVLRRNVLDEVLTVCEDIAAGSSDGRIFLTSSSAGASPACVYGGQTANYTAWNTFRTEKGGSTTVYIYNLAANVGEFVEFTSETDSGATMYIEQTSGAFVNAYTANNSAVYALEEWRYRLDSFSANADILQVVQNNDTANPMNVVFGLSDFQVQAILQDGSSLDTFTAADDWSDLEAIQIIVSGTEQTGKQPVTSTLTSRFFPRNILSL